MYLVLYCVLDKSRQRNTSLSRLSHPLLCTLLRNGFIEYCPHFDVWSRWVSCFLNLLVLLICWLVGNKRNRELAHRKQCTFHMVSSLWIWVMTGLLYVHSKWFCAWGWWCVAQWPPGPGCLSESAYILSWSFWEYLEFANQIIETVCKSKISFL